MIKNQKLFYICLSLSILASSTVFSQIILPFKTTPKSVIGYVEYTPPDYNTNTKKYPLVIFLHGKGESGPASNDPAVLATGYNSLVFYGPPKYVKLGTKFPFLLVCPQLKNNYGNWPSDYVMEVIEYVKTYLRVDPNRIYLTGTSLGGGGAWITAQDYPDYFAALAPVAGSTNSTSKACPMAASHLPVWAFHGDADGVVPLSTSSRMVNAINACGSNPLAKLTIYPGLGHNAYSLAYDPTHTIHNPNLYDWMLAQVNNGGTLPVNKAPVANAGADKTALPTNSVTFYGTGSDSDGSVIDYSWVKISGGIASLKNARTPNLLVYGLESGSYTFRLTVTDNLGAWNANDVTLVVSGSTTTTTNVAPAANAGSDKTITLPTNTLSLTGSGTDSDGRIASYQWTKVSGSTATLTNAATSILSLSALVSGSYVFRLTVTDDKGATASDDVKVTVNTTTTTTPTTTSKAPVANAGTDRTIKLPVTSVVLNGSATTITGTTITAYKWEQVAGTIVTMQNATTANLTIGGITTTGTRTFKLTVKNSLNYTDYSLVKITFQ